MLYIIGNYKLLNARSMDLYAENLTNFCSDNRLNYRFLKAKILLNKIKFQNKLFTKYLGYIDNYIIFGIYLFFKIKKNDLVHICDHANSILYLFIRSKKIIITCHDLINIKKALNGQLSFTGKIYQHLIIYFLNKIRLIICVSKHTQNELNFYLKIKNKKTRLVYHSLNQNYFSYKKNTNKFKFKYFMHVGDNKFYKNKYGLIKIFYELIKLKKFKNHKLILVGSKINNEIKYLIIKLKLKSKIINLINIKSYKLSNLYVFSDGLIFPSFEEGFGWPIIEAQNKGCLVITSNKAPMNEIGKNSCIFIDPFNYKKSANIIDKNFIFKNKIISLGYTNISRFSKKKFFKKMKAIYLNEKQN